MPIDVLRNIQRLRQQQGLSLQEASEKIGTTKSQLDKLEKGERRLTVEWLFKIAEGLDVAVADIIDSVGTLREAPTAPPYQPAPPAVSPPQAALLPVMVRSDALSGRMHLLETPSSHVPRPPSLQSVPNAFALYMPDDSQQPRYGAGDLLYINPEKPVAAGQWVLTQSAEGVLTVECFDREAMRRDRVRLLGLISGVEVRG